MDDTTLTIGEFEEACDGLTWDDLAASPLADSTIDDLAAMTPDDIKELLHRAK